MMKRFIKIYSVLFLFLSPVLVWAQCAMCRTQIVNNVSHGETSLAAGLNLGILYLFFTPYLLIGVVAYLWYRSSKVNEGKKHLTGHIGG